jgi:hypothetical protein
MRSSPAWPDFVSELQRQDTSYMTTDGARDLRNKQADNEPCDHIILVLQRTKNGYLTGQ